MTSEVSRTVRRSAASVEKRTESRYLTDGGEQPENLDPATYVDADTPVVIIPRGGADEVGRSCYQVETVDHTFLVDCGLNQGTGGQFPDFRGIEEGQIDGVFLTHAHIDHSGALPVLEHRNLLSDHAKVITTSGTAALVDLLLRDSLKIHREESHEQSREQQFTKTDVEDVLDRFETVTGYRKDTVDGTIPFLDQSDVTFKFGNAAHLLGSAWLALETRGRRVVFSGDIGGRSRHLPDIESPPSADTLVLESTYGDRSTHPSFDDARTQLFTEAIDAASEGTPVLIPTFAVGRAQEILQVFRERWDHLSADEQEQITIVVDGLAVQATERYHAYANQEYIASNVMNYVENAGDPEPFFPSDIERVTRRKGDRAAIVDPSSDATPIVVCPSGMLTGGFSPVYLYEFSRRFDSFQLFFTGYQAEGTLGRRIQAAVAEADPSEAIKLPVNVEPLTESETPHGEPQSDIESSGQDQQGERTIQLQPEEVTTIGGFSGHAAQQGLLEFARQVDAHHIHLVHGESAVQRTFVDYLDKNTTAETVTCGGFRQPLPIYPPMSNAQKLRQLTEGDPQITVREGDHSETENEDGELAEVLTKLNNLEDGQGKEAEHSQLTAADIRTAIERLQALEQEMAQTRNDVGRTEAEIRRIVRDELNQ